MKRVMGTILAGLLWACGGTPPPPGPTPTPPPRQPGWDCANPPTLSGFVPVADGVPGQYTVVLKPQFTSWSGEKHDWTVLHMRAVVERHRGLKRVKYGTRRFSAQMDVRTATSVAADPDVWFIHNSVRMKANLSWGLDMIDGRSIHLDGRYTPGGTGRGVHFAGIDTGIYPHADFKDRMGPGYNATPGAPGDGNGHGTHTAGTMVGTNWGVAKEGTIHPVKVLDGEGRGTDDDVAEGIDWVTRLKRQLATPMVANLSLGGSVSPALNNAVCNAIEAGVVVVVAAGNDYGADACEGSPSGVNQAITVAASDRRGVVANFSNQGLCVDIWAPGVDIESTWLNNLTNTISGTSMATPHVAGAAGLILEKNPTWTPAQVRTELVETATRDLLQGVFANTMNLFLHVGEG